VTETLKPAEPKFKSISALKQLVSNFILTSAQPEPQPLLLEIYETFPLLLAHDGHYFIDIAFDPSSHKQLQSLLDQDKMKLCEMPLYRLSF
jgi:hypothetical protein